jgi:hypothetical protein
LHWHRLFERDVDEGLHHRKQVADPAIRWQFGVGLVDPSLRCFEDLASGRLTLDDQGQVTLLSGTQVEVLAVACRHMHDVSQAPRSPAG